jgi:2-keto-3-deoxy-L-rhamnonate aldolase RhmA
MSGVVDFRSRLAGGSPVVGMVVRTPSHHVIEVLAAAPPDERVQVVMLDTEHAPFDPSVIVRVPAPSSRGLRSGSCTRC